MMDVDEVSDEGEPKPKRARNASCESEIPLYFTIYLQSSQLIMTSALPGLRSR